MCQNHSHLLATRILDAQITGPNAITITVELAQELTVHLQTGGKLIVPSSESVSLHYHTEVRHSSSETAMTAEHTTSSPAVAGFATVRMPVRWRPSSGS